MNRNAIQRDRARYMTATHRRAVEAALHIERTASNIAALLDEDCAPEIPRIRHLEEWTAIMEGQLSELRGGIKGLRHEYRLRRQGQL